jgi:hypothetical protein
MHLLLKFITVLACAVVLPATALAVCMGNAYRKESEIGLASAMRSDAYAAAFRRYALAAILSATWLIAMFLN